MTIKIPRLNTYLGYLGRKLHDRNDVNNVNDLELTLHKELAQTHIHIIRTLTDSIRMRYRDAF
jgi:hypothetical protein